ncbi:MAG: hypothetical protein M1819_006287 [Sarea resinae]|nr:MAG: hypothetical protein M1819_006287 [Sarea resinae]
MRSATIATLSALTLASIVTANSNSWAGVNNYFVHTLSEGEQQYWVNEVASVGAKVVRLWVTGSDGSCAKGSQTISMTDVEPTLGSYNNASLIALDNLLAKLQPLGIKALISPHNANDLSGTYCDEYCNTYGAGGFYTTDDAKTAYDNRLAYILNFVSPNFGKPWSQLSEAILAFDVQNEPFISDSSLAANNDESDWLCGRAGNMAAITNGSGVKISTGGIGGSQYDGHAYNYMSKAIECDAIDIISMHSYLTKSQWGEFIPSALQNVNNKHLVIEEWGVGNACCDAEVPDDQFEPLYELFNGAGIPHMYWELVSAADETQDCSAGYPGQTCCHESPDGYQIGPDSTKGNITAAISGANSVAGAQDWTGYVY